MNIREVALFMLIGVIKYKKLTFLPELNLSTNPDEARLTTFWKQDRQLTSESYVARTTVLV